MPLQLGGFGGRWIALLLTIVSGLAQQEPSGAPEPGEATYWRAEFSSGKYVVAHEFIASVSLSEYIVDQAERVSEVSVGTYGGVAARFYFSEPLGKPQSADQGMGDVLSAIKGPVPMSTVPMSTERPVAKTYPDTTHAHTVEYRVPDRKSLLRLFDSLEESWITRKSTLYRAGTGGE